ncbi:MAG: hypothetical protein SGILL_005507 [Bacillariaceae sp.]
MKSVSVSASAFVAASSQASLRHSQTRQTTTSSTVFANRKATTGASPNKKNNTKSPKTKKKTTAATPITTSFEPIWSGRFEDMKPVPVHTLILGTHPSIKSLEEQQYFGHPMNAFWWIAGDCLGFRRSACLSPNTGKPYAMAPHLRYDLDKVIPYSEQQRALVGNGFALWDIVRQCRRPGSLDQDIYEEEPNALRDFAEQHRHTLRRIVFANGGTGSKIFIKHFQDWLGSGQLEALSGHEGSQKIFAKTIAREQKKRSNERVDACASSSKKIGLVVALGVSPAAARYSYVEKREFWERYVYQPGLDDFEAAGKQQ